MPNRIEEREEKAARCREAERQGVARGKAPTTVCTIYEVSPGGRNALISNVSNTSPLPSSLP